MVRPQSARSSTSFIGLFVIGSTARIGPRHLITTNPELVRRMNAVRSTYTRAEWYNGLRLHPTRDNITSYRDEAIHAQLRSQMALGVSALLSPTNPIQLVSV